VGCLATHQWTIPKETAFTHAAQLPQLDNYLLVHNICLPPSPQQQNTTSISNSLGQVMQNVESNSTSLNQLVQNVESINNTGIAAQVNSILDARTPTLPPNFPAELRSVETHRNCTTSVADRCDINPLAIPGGGSALCETNDVPLHMEVSTLFYFVSHHHGNKVLGI